MNVEERELIRGWLMDYATLNETQRGYVLTYPQLVSKLWGLVSDGCWVGVRSVSDG